VKTSRVRAVTGARRGRPRSFGRRVAGFALKGVALVLLASAVLVVPWRWLPPPTSAFMLRERLAGNGVYQRWTPYPAISRNLVLCVIAAEDQKFAAHHGFDVDAIVRAVEERRRKKRGASTISQQVAKNLYLWPGRSFVRKGLEAYFTVWLEQTWPKRRILEVYLNVAEFGPGIFGAGAASEVMFGKPPSALTLSDAALLAAVLPNPKRMSARRPSPYVSGRAGEIEQVAHRLGTRFVAGI
jgi:monofunctional biosynthetic peptidoglycan transglycosylase